ncbi:MAG: hypothetical protein PHY47_14655 [Lachnospiraceae bacterium]|nr:hypothetical protein [Lachnospiraceae bacterium]
MININEQVEQIGQKMIPTDQVKKLREQISNAYINGDVETLCRLIDENPKLVIYDNDLSYFHYLRIIYQEDIKKDGNSTIFSRGKTMEEELEVFCTLKHLIQRVEWCAEYDIQELRNFILDWKISAQELVWVIRASTTKFEYVLGKIMGEL